MTVEFVVVIIVHVQTVLVYHMVMLNLIVQEHVEVQLNTMNVVSVVVMVFQMVIVTVMVM